MIKWSMKIQKVRVEKKQHWAVNDLAVSFFQLYPQTVASVLCTLARLFKITMAVTRDYSYLMSPN